MTFQPPTVVAKLPIYHSLLNKQAPLPPEKAGNKNQKLILFSQGAAMSGAPILAVWGNSQNSSP